MALRVGRPLHRGMKPRGFAVFGAALFAGACSGAAEDGPQRFQEETFAIESLELKPRGVMLQVPAEHFAASGSVDSLAGRRSVAPGAFAGPGEPPLPIYLNRFGGTYSPGRDDSRNNTSIVPNQRSTVGPYAGSQAQWDQVVSCLQDLFSRFNVVMVEQEPAGGEYIESVIGGSPQQVGLSRGVGGVAPIDNFNCSIIPNAIVFTFSDVVGSNPRASCEIAAQEIAHAISLDHELHCPDPMTYLSGCGNKEFRDVDAQCGEFQARACNCGRQRQNSVEILFEKLGPSDGTPPPPPPPPDPIAPSVGVVAPAHNETLAENSVITVTATASDNVRVTSLELLWSFNGNTFPCPFSGGGGSVQCTLNGNTATWSLRVGEGDRTFSVRARDAAGNTTSTPPRTVHLGTAAPPPDDTVSPVVNVVSPNDSATLAANSNIQVVAEVSDNLGLGAVELLWTYAGDAFPCPFQGQGVSCTRQGTTHTWTLSVGVGTRRFSVRAIDLAGNVTESAERTILLGTDPDEPVEPATDTVAEDNDSAADAFASRCGTAIDLVISQGDDDWFSFEAPAGARVEVGIAAAAGSQISLELYAPDGTTRLALAQDVLASGGSLQVVSPGPALLARVFTAMGSRPYRLTGVCSFEMPPVEDPAVEDPPVQDPPENPENPRDPEANHPATRTEGRAALGGGCACSTHVPASSAAPLLALVVLAGLSLLRRRR